MIVAIQVTFHFLTYTALVPVALVLSAAKAPIALRGLALATAFAIAAFAVGLALPRVPLTLNLASIAALLSLTCAEYGEQQSFSHWSRHRQRIRQILLGIAGLLAFAQAYAIVEADGICFASAEDDSIACWSHLIPATALLIHALTTFGIVALDLEHMRRNCDMLMSGSLAIAAVIGSLLFPLFHLFPSATLYEGPMEPVDGIHMTLVGAMSIFGAWNFIDARDGTHWSPALPLGLIWTSIVILLHHQQSPLGWLIHRQAATGFFISGVLAAFSHLAFYRQYLTDVHLFCGLWTVVTFLCASRQYVRFANNHGLDQTAFFVFSSGIALLASRWARLLASIYKHFAANADYEAPSSSKPFLDC